MTHTPGPWTVTFIGSSVHDGFQISSPSGLLFNIEQSFREKTDHAEHAFLIAAAPDLLKALKLARECISYCRRAHKDAQSGDGIPVELFIDAAIAKATSVSGVPSRLPDSGTQNAAEQIEQE